MASRNWGWLVSIIQIVLRALLPALTPLIKEKYEEALLKLLTLARGTDNPIDDLFVEFLFNILDMPIPAEE